MIGDSTGWKIVGASGVTVKAGTPIVNIEVGGSYIRMPIQNKSTNTSIMLKGIGGGVGMGLSISTPVVTASGSLDSFPAGGLGEIVRGKAAPREKFSNEDFLGHMMVFTLSAGKELSGSVGIALWLTQPIEACMLSLSCSKSELKEIAQDMVFNMLGMASPFAGLVALKKLEKMTKAAGMFACMNAETQLLGAGLDIFSYKVNI